MNATPLAQERVLPNPEQPIMRSNNSHNLGKIVQIGDDIIPKIQQKVSDTISTDTSEGILVKDGGILPGAESFNLYTLPKRHPFGRQ